MLSCLKETNREHGKPGALSMRRVAAAVCLITSIASAFLAMVIIYRFTADNLAAQDWRFFIPLFFPCFAFLFGTLMLLFFTTWEDVKEIVCAASGINRSGRNAVSDTGFQNTNFHNGHDFPEQPGRMMD